MIERWNFHPELRNLKWKKCIIMNTGHHTPSYAFGTRWCMMFSFENPLHLRRTFVASLRTINFVDSQHIKGNEYTCTGGKCRKYFCLSRQLGSAFKGKNLLLLKKSISEGAWLKESKQEVT